jgi:hypothetical protein
MADGMGPLTVWEAVEQGKHGFTVGKRLSVPCHFELISLRIARPASFVGTDELITDFSPGNRSISIVEKPDRTDIYVRAYDDLQERFGHWKGRLIVTCCEKGTDIFNLDNHIRVALNFRDDEPWVKMEILED